MTRARGTKYIRDSVDTVGPRDPSLTFSVATDTSAVTDAIKTAVTSAVRDAVAKPTAPKRSVTTDAPKRAGPMPKPRIDGLLAVYMGSAAEVKTIALLHSKAKAFVEAYLKLSPGKRTDTISAPSLTPDEMIVARAYVRHVDDEDLPIPLQTPYGVAAMLVGAVRRATQSPHYLLRPRKNYP